VALNDTTRQSIGMDTLRKKFGNNVVSLRKERGISQEELADLCGVARSYMSRVERGQANPSLDAIEKIAAGLDILPSMLFRNV